MDKVPYNFNLMSCVHDVEKVLEEHRTPISRLDMVLSTVKQDVAERTIVKPCEWDKPNEFQDKQVQNV